MIVPLLLCCRGGKQIDFLGLNDNYKFELQEIVSLGNIKTIKEVRQKYKPQHHHAHLSGCYLFEPFIRQNYQCCLCKHRCVISG